MNRGVALCVTAFAVLLASSGCRSISPLPSDVEFVNRLAIPPLAESATTRTGERLFTLEARSGSTEFLAGTRTETWGYNGDLLGPTLRARDGERVRVEVQNSLTEPTSVHWHGMHLPARMDGGPHQMVDVAGTWSPRWTVDQPAATLWYHPHPHGTTESHVYRGLAGFFLVDPPGGPDRRLPHRYGVDDIPVAVQDKKLADDGALDFDDDGSEVGVLGNVVMANGTVGGYHEVSTELVRLRLLNGSTARVYNFGFDDDREFQLIASDGGLLERPLPRERIQLSPGERAEIVVRMEPGEATVLRSYAPDLGPVVANFAVGGKDETDVLELRASEALMDSPPLPGKLTTLEAADEEDAQGSRRFELEERTINGRTMEMSRIDAAVEVGTAEIWEVENRNLYPHNFHVHDVQYRVLSIDGEPPPAELQGRKDTIYLAPRRTYRLLVKFEDYTDPHAPLMYHCHLLRHEDEGMMGQFVVVDSADID